jgi:hypothetical protein
MAPLGLFGLLVAIGVATRVVAFFGVTSGSLWPWIAFLLASILMAVMFIRIIRRVRYLPVGIGGLLGLLGCGLATLLVTMNA